MVYSKVKIIPVIFTVIALFWGSTVHALPFNDDMVHSKNAKGEHMYYSTGQVMRARPEGAVSIGMNDYHVNSREEAEKLKNPNKDDARSWKLGKRLFKVNCSPCHGNIEVSPYQPGAVAGKLLKLPPDLGSDALVTPKSDGHYFGVMDFGYGLMPALGWKLSTQEHWDIISYVRQVQEKRAGK